MKKFDRIEAFVADLVPAAPAAVHPCYAGYFACFNRGDYYEAHDVLEHLWLADKTGPNGDFYKGLIQLAGAYVHLRKQHLRPNHPKDGRRLRPAARLFDLAATHLSRFGPRHEFLDVLAVVSLARTTARALRECDFARNPWSPGDRPEIVLDLPR